MAWKLEIGNNIFTTDHKKFRKCTPTKIKAWWEDVKQNVPNYANYNWHIVGGMANGSQESRDVDIVITPLSGETYDTNELPTLQSVMVSAHQLALDNAFHCDLKAEPYHWPSPLGFTRDFFKIVCWDKITITIDDEVYVWADITRRQDATTEKLGELDLWKTTWTNDTGEPYFPYGSTAKAVTYTAGYVPVEEWCNNN